MSDFSIPDGFREVGQKEFIETPGDRFTGYFDEVARYFVRQEPVPALPTTPNTTIGITAANGASVLDDPVFTLRQMSAGLRWWNERGPHTAEWLQERITGFKVLSEPRAVTAKAVIEALEHGKGLYRERVTEVERDFGVT